VFATVGLTVEPVRGLVRERLGVGSAPLPDQELRFSDAAKDALRFANRIALGEPGIPHVLIAIVGRQENNACEIVRLLGTDPGRIRFETKLRARPPTPTGPSDARRTALRLVGSIPLERLPQIDFGD
jgi:hypothetical protein